MMVKKGGGGPSSSSMKAVGRNMARANNQKGGAKAPGYASGGGVCAPVGGGKVRGTGAMTKKTTWKGAF